MSCMSPSLLLLLGRVEDLLGRVPLILCFLDGNATQASTIPHEYARKQKDAFEYRCLADGVGPASRRGPISHLYEINTWPVEHVACGTWGSETDVFPLNLPCGAKHCMYPTN